MNEVSLWKFSIIVGSLFPQLTKILSDAISTAAGGFDGEFITCFNGE